MSLKLKAVLVQGVLFALFYFLSLPAVYVILDQGLQDIEGHRTERIVERILKRIDYEQRILSAKAGDWALWGDTVRFVESKDPSYIERNLDFVPFHELSIHYMFFYDSQGQLISANGYDSETKKPLSCSQKTKDTLQNLGIVQRILQTNKESLQGLALIEERLALLSARAIRMPKETIAAPRGVLVMVKFVTPEYHKSLLKMEDFPFEIRLLSSHSTLPSIRGIEPLGTTKPMGRTPTRKVWQGKEAIFAYRTLVDIQGRPVATLSVEIPTLVYEVQTKMLWIIGLGLLLLAFMICISGYALLNRAFLGRLTRLAEQIASIGEAQDFKERVEAGGNDEIAQLSRSINQMLEGLNSARQLERAYQYVQGIIQSANVGILVIDPDGNIHETNPRLEEISGYSRAELLSSDFNWERLFEPSVVPKLKGCVSQTLKTLEPLRIEAEILRKDGGYEAALVSMAPLPPQKYQKGKRLVMGITDITQIKLLQEELRNLSFFDTLTGVYNRNYFEQEISRFSKGRQTIGLILADVDLLKPVNDTYGHPEGDKLLKKAAKLLQNTSRAEDIVARIGGDEFAIILPGINESSLEKILVRLKAAIQEANLKDGRVPLSLSMGKAMSHGNPFDPSELIKEADRRMYKNKARRHQEVLEIMDKANLRSGRNEGGETPWNKDQGPQEE